MSSASLLVRTTLPLPPGPRAASTVCAARSASLHRRCWTACAQRSQSAQARAAPASSSSAPFMCACAALSSGDASTAASATRRHVAARSPAPARARLSNSPTSATSARQDHASAVAATAVPETPEVEADVRSSAKLASANSLMAHAWQWHANVPSSMPRASLIARQPSRPEARARWDRACQPRAALVLANLTSSRRP